MILFTTATSETPTPDTTTQVWDLEEIISTVIHWFATSGVKLLIGLIVLFIVFALINSISKSIRKRMIKKHRDATITNVVYKVIRFSLKGVAFFMFLGFVGIDTAGVGSIIASCAVAIGLALQGSLSNIAGWCIIIFMRPFKLDDYIECQGESGFVEDIRLFYTYLRTPDNKVVMIPNGALANGNIKNYSIKDIRRLEQLYTISYATDTAKAVEVIKNVLNNHELVLKDPECFVTIASMDSRGVTLTSRTWVKTDKYWDLHFDLMPKIKQALDENGIEIPVNQVAVQIKEK